MNTASVYSAVQGASGSIGSGPISATRSPPEGRQPLSAMVNKPDLAERLDNSAAWPLRILSLGAVSIDVDVPVGWRFPKWPQRLSRHKEAAQLG